VQTDFDIVYKGDLGVYCRTHSWSYCCWCTRGNTRKY